MTGNRRNVTLTKLHWLRNSSRANLVLFHPSFANQPGTSLHHYDGTCRSDETNNRASCVKALITLECEIVGEVHFHFVSIPSLLNVALAR